MTSQCVTGSPVLVFRFSTILPSFVTAVLKKTKADDFSDTVFKMEATLESVSF